MLVEEILDRHVIEQPCTESKQIFRSQDLGEDLFQKVVVWIAVVNISTMAPWSVTCQDEGRRAAETTWPLSGLRSNFVALPESSSLLK